MAARARAVAAGRGSSARRSRRDARRVPAATSNTTVSRTFGTFSRPRSNCRFSRACCPCPNRPFLLRSMEMPGRTCRRHPSVRGRRCDLDRAPRRDGRARRSAQDAAESLRHDAPQPARGAPPGAAPGGPRGAHARPSRAGRIARGAARDAQPAPAGAARRRALRARDPAGADRSRRFGSSGCSCRPPSSAATPSAITGSTPSTSRCTCWTSAATASAPPCCRSLPATRCAPARFRRPISARRRKCSVR